MECIQERIQKSREFGGGRLIRYITYFRERMSQEKSLITREKLKFFIYAVLYF